MFGNTPKRTACMNCTVSLSLSDVMCVSVRDTESVKGSMYYHDYKDFNLIPLKVVDSILDPI